MKKLIQHLFKVNTALLILLFYCFAFCLQVINTDFVVNNKIWYEYMSKQEDAKYSDEYDEYIADFEDDLKELDLDEEEEDDSYSWDFFFMDSAMVLVPYLLTCIGLIALIFITFQFYESFKDISFLYILKSATMAYLIFYLKDLFTAFYFLLFKSNYQYEDVQNLDGKLTFAISDLLDKLDKSSWFYDALQDVNLYLVSYILLIPFFLCYVTNHSYTKLLRNILIPVLCGFILYESIYTYITL